jgi:hypothetical protein
MSKLNWNRLIFYVLGTFTGAWALRTFGTLFKRA